MAAQSSTIAPKYIAHEVVIDLYAAIQGQAVELPKFIQEDDVHAIYTQMAATPFQIRFTPGHWHIGEHRRVYCGDRWEIVKHDPATSTANVVMYSKDLEDLAPIALVVSVMHAYQAHYGFN